MFIKDFIELENKSNVKSSNIAEHSITLFLTENTIHNEIQYTTVGDDNGDTIMMYIFMSITSHILKTEIGLRTRRPSVLSLDAVHNTALPSAPPDTTTGPPLGVGWTHRTQVTLFVCCFVLAPITVPS